MTKYVISLNVKDKNKKDEERTLRSICDYVGSKTNCSIDSVQSETVNFSLDNDFDEYWMKCFGSGQA